MKSTSSRIERPAPVHRVERLGLRPSEAHHPRRADREAGLLQVGEDEPGLAGGDGVGLDDRERLHDLDVESSGGVMIRPAT